MFGLYMLHEPEQGHPASSVEGWLSLTAIASNAAFNEPDPLALWSMEFTPQNYKVMPFIERIEKGEIALPEFQRDFLWQPPAIADLLRTVARQWPAGTFLVLEVEDHPPFAFKPLKGAPPAEKPRILILDGQQRTTALYQALTEQAGEIYFVEMGNVMDAGSFEDDHLKYLKTASFSRAYPDLATMARERIVKVSLLANDEAFLRWTRHLPEDQQEKAFGCRQNLLPGFREYEIPAVRLPHEVPLAAIAKIFETLNRTGMRLATFDLMVARLYPHGFKLRDHWEEVRAGREQFSEVRPEYGVELLKVIALQEHLRQISAGVQRTVKGIRESDVLALEPQTVISQWENAVEALARAIDFAQGRCGAIRWGLMPSATMLLPLAHMLSPGQPNRTGFETDLERWFWATSFDQTYSQGANTQAVADTRALIAWQNDPAAVPEVVRTFKPNIEQLRDGRRRNEMLVRGIVCRTITNNARDWITDKRFQDLDGKLEIHHVIPDEFLEKHWDGEADPVLNFAVLTESTNKKLRNQLPKDVLLRPDISRDAVGSHGIAPSTLEETTETSADPLAYINRFFDERRDALVGLICAATGVPVPSPSGE